MTDIAVRQDAGFAPWLAEARATIALGSPLVLTNLAQIAITTTDVVMMGWLGPEALAAGALAANVFFACFIFGLGLAMATAPMMAQALGRKLHSVRDVRRSLRQGLWLTALYATPLWLLIWQTEALLLLLGQDPALAAAGGGYGRAMMWGLVPALWFIVLRSFVSAVGRPNAALVVTLLAILLNAISNWLLMFGHLGFPRLELVGAGISSSLANLFMFGALAAYLYIDRRFRRFHVLGRFWRADWPRLRELCRIGVPIGFTLAFEVTIFNAAVFLMGLFGTAALAAHQIALQIASVTFMVPMGLSQAATVRVGYAIGAGDREGVRRAGWTAIVMGGSFMAAMAVVLLVAPRPLVGFFIDRHDPANAEVVRLAVQFLAVAGVFQIADGLQSLGAGVLRGLKDTRVPMIFAGIGYWVIGFGLSVALGFGADMKGLGIWIGLAAGLGVVAVLMLTRWSLRGRLGLLAAARRG